MQEANRSLLMLMDSYSKAEGDSRYRLNTATTLSVNHSSAARYIRLSGHDANTQIRYQGGNLLFRRVSNSGSATTVLVCNSGVSTVSCNGSISANNFNSNSDTKLKDDQQVAPTADAAAILAAVPVKT